jgi:uncharacterized membrane protein (DUF106 family)
MLASKFLKESADRPFYWDNSLKLWFYREPTGLWKRLEEPVLVNRLFDWLLRGNLYQLVEENLIKKIVFNLQNLQFRELVEPNALLFRNGVFFLESRDFTSVTIFILIGLLTSFFCKNMIVILFVAICITHILKYPRSLEGAENMDEEEKDKEEKENMENEEEKDEEKENMENKKNTQEMTGEMKEFMEVQNKIIGGMAELEPLMQKAEGFIEKFEKYYKKKGLCPFFKIDHV